MVTRAYNNVTIDLGTSAADNYGLDGDRIILLGGRNTISTRSGDDLVDSTRALPGMSFNTIFLGLGNDEFRGGSGFDAVFDGAGDDLVTLGGGNDVAYADRGNDHYDGGEGVDTIRFDLVDVVSVGDLSRSSIGVSVDLARTSAQNLRGLGSDTIVGFENLFGSAGSDRLYGDSVGNELRGFDGNDVIDGRGGDDLIFGGDNGSTVGIGDGADILIGGLGRDTLVLAEGRAMRDVADFNALAESGVTTATADIVQGFDKGGRANDDKIDLSSIDANPYLAGNQAFKFIGGKAFGSHVGEVRLAVVDGDTHVLIDADRDGAAEMRIIVEDVTGLTAGDFVL